jgi:hypothetical protein
MLPWMRAVLFRDELVGATKLDLEDRVFEPLWHLLGTDAEKHAGTGNSGTIPPRPLERRFLYSATSRTDQGSLRMWLDILTPEEAKNNPLLDISPTPPAPYQLRVVVWKTRGLKARKKQSACALRLQLS